RPRRDRARQGNAGARARAALRARPGRGRPASALLVGGRRARAHRRRGQGRHGAPQLRGERGPADRARRIARAARRAVQAGFPHVRNRRADPARPKGRQDAPYGLAAQDAEHGRVGAGDRGLRRKGRQGAGRLMTEIEPDSSGEGLRVGIVRSRFNERIGVAMLEACRKRLGELRVTALTVVSVPGALEAPLALQKLANTEKYDALIALGAVIRGETRHFETVANESASGLMQVQLDSGVPVANGILTTDTEEQAKARAAQKGRDCAEVAVEMANLGKSIAKSHK